MPGWLIFTGLFQHFPLPHKHTPSLLPLSSHETFPYLTFLYLYFPGKVLQGRLGFAFTWGCVSQRLKSVSHFCTTVLQFFNCQLHKGTARQVAHPGKKEITKADFCAVQTCPLVLAKALTVQRFQLVSEEGHGTRSSLVQHTHTLSLAFGSRGAAGSVPSTGSGLASPLHGSFLDLHCSHPTNLSSV